MEIQMPSHLILASLFLILSIFFFILSKLKTTRLNLPPGPAKLPLIGNLLNLIGPVPHRALHNLALKHGPLMHLRLGQLSAVVVSSADGAEQVMKTHDLNFATRPSILVSEIISYDNTSISFGPYGDYWRQLKKISTVELLSMKRVRSFRSIRERVFAGLMTWIASREGSLVNLSEKLYSSTFEVTSMAALGMKTEGREKLLEIFDQVTEAASGFDISDLYPSIKLLQKVSGLRRKLMRLRREADVIFDGIIHDHMRVAKSTDDDENVKHRDILDVILKLQADGLECPLTNENIKSVLVDILAGGSETSATAMDWAMAEMLKNPRVLQKAQEEVRRVFDDKGYVDESSRIHELKYLKSIIKETMRTHPPLPLLLPRKCRQRCQINGYDIPTDTKVIINEWAINRDPKRWKNAELFEPERFIDETLVDFRGNDFEYIPFGAGRRMCPGINFALASIELPLAMFLYHFDWSLGDGEELDMAEGFGITARRVKQLFVVPIVKRPFTKLVI